MVRRIMIVGAGVVGTALARELSGDPANEVMVLERSRAGELAGSTEYAPGFVGLYNDAPVLTQLARASAEVYDAAGAGFARAGGIELATTESGAAELARRARSAREAGLIVEELDAERAVSLAPSVIDGRHVVGAWRFSQDGVARPAELTAALRAAAEANGARFIHDARVTGVTKAAGGLCVTTADGDSLIADDVALTGGIWGPALTELVGIDLPLFPVAHPYVYSSADPRHMPGPFVRWPEHHVYARVHADRLGIGSYDHVPRPVTQEQIDAGASLPWLSEPFDPAIDRAMQLLPKGSRFMPQRRVNGVFAMTPDNLPLVGAHPALPGLWSAQGVWVTHAAGAARVLAAAMAGAPLPHKLDPHRFDDMSAGRLRDQALSLYRDIYANDA